MELPALLKPNATRGHKFARLGVERRRIYNSWDTHQQAQLLPVLMEELRRNGQLDFYREWFRVVPTVMRMQRRGFGVVDWDAHARVSAELEAESREVEAGIVAHTTRFGDALAEAEQWRTENAAAHPTWGAKLAKGYASRVRKAEQRRASFFNKSQDLRGFLFDELALTPAPASRRHQRPARSVKADAIQYMLEHLLKREEPHRALLENLSHVFRIRKVQQGYLEPLENDPHLTRDGRLHPTIRLYAVETLRWSYARPSLHNWPPRMQPIVRAAPGHVFVSVDYKQIEAGIMAILANDAAELHEWQRPGGDLHRLMATDALGLSLTTWAELPEDRRKAIRDVFKTARYERMYGGEGTKARSKEGCPCVRCRQELTGTAVRFALGTTEMRRALERWSQKHPGMVRWRESMLRSVRDNGNSWTSPFGYRVVSCQPIEEAKRSWWNRPMQHCTAMVINRAAIDLDALGCPLVFQHHDSLIAEVLERHAAEWGQVMVEVMTQAIPELGGVRFPVDVKVGHSWKDVK